MNQDIKSKVEWFLANLDLQLEDLALEEAGVKVNLFFDTADIRDAVLGMAAFYDAHYSFDLRLFKSSRTLVRCLATSGWLGKIEMLPPHQAEFLTLLNVDFGYYQELDIQEFVRKFLTDVQDAIRPSSLDSETLVSISNEMSDDELLSFVHLMRQQAQSAELYFSALESIGPWRPRLARWLREESLNLSSENFNFGSIVTTPEFQDLKDAFDARRPSYNRMNNFADAAAVAILIYQVAAFRGGHPVLPRFFVPSKLFYEAVERAGKLASLSYPLTMSGVNSPHLNSVTLNSVLTSSDYFIFRAVFRPSAYRVASATGFTPLNLHELRSVVAEILQTQVPLTEETIRSIEVSGRSLSSLIDEVKEFSFLNNIWLRFIELDYVKRVRDLQRQTKDVAHVRQVKKAIQATRDAIQENAREYKRVRSLWHELEQATLHLQARVKLDPSRPLDVFRDLGLLRFGFPANSHQAIRDLVEPIFSGGEAEQIAARNAVITAYYGERRNLKDTEELTNLVRAAVVMWLARMDVQLFNLLDNIKKSHSLPHYSLEIVYSAAAFRQAKQLRQGRTILHKLTNEYAALPSRDRQQKSDMATGIAYLFFHLWWCSGHRPTWFPPADGYEKPDAKGGKKLINHAIEYAKRAYDAAYPEELAKRAYALNQRLYYLVMGSGDERRPEMESVLTRLMAVKSDQLVWQHRFDDTLARYFHRLAVSASTESEWGERMKQARYHFEQARIFEYGDEQVQFYGTVLAVDLALGFGRASLTTPTSS